MARGSHSLLMFVIVASISPGKTQSSNGAEIVMTCDCVRQLNAQVMPTVNTSINALTFSVDQLFRLTQNNAPDPELVGDRNICLLCGKIRNVKINITKTPFRKRPVKHCDRRKCSNRFPPPCCRKRGRRQVHFPLDFPQPGPDSLPVCPINEVLATAQTAQDATQLVQEVTASVRADTSTVSQDLLASVTDLYNEVNESVRALHRATDPNSSECRVETYVPDVVFPGEF
ncbi:unnamed protein product [Meganyctiphanes norvegica]|uniref:Uncharacterized protein n=1 Tax=Meganyctiphanes norvegica TaxID=48144 RepID=A0AAV2S9P7_MEGNR